MYDFQARMSEGRDQAKRNRDRGNSSAFEVFANDRQRFAGMSDDDWHARCADDEAYTREADELAGGVDAPPAWLPGEKETTTRRKSNSHPRPNGSQVMMTAKQYVRACKKLDLTTVREMANELGISPAMAQRYAADKWPVSKTVAKLLETKLENKKLRALVALGTTDI